eukprot:3109615-Rhodomonas_salina.2
MACGGVVAVNGTVLWRTGLLRRLPLSCGVPCIVRKPVCGAKHASEAGCVVPCAVLEGSVSMCGSEGQCGAMRGAEAGAVVRRVC